VNQLDTAAKFFAKKFTTTTFCKGCYFPAGLLKQKKREKKQSKKFREDEVFQGSLVFEINLYGQGQIWRQKSNRSPWFRIQKKEGATENKKSPGP